MPIVHRFKTHDEFEESCYKHGITWIPPYVFKLRLRDKKRWQRRVICGKERVKRPRETDKAFIKKYKQCLKEATRIDGKIDPQSLPPDVRARFLEKKRRLELCHRYEKVIKERDIKIYLHKWYPWSYNTQGKPAVVLQGFYSVKAARKRFLLYYGKKALEHVHWIKGKSALERKFEIGQGLMIDGRRRKPISKILLTENYRTSVKTAKRVIGRELSKKKRLKSQPKERYLLKLVDKFNYGTKEYRAVLQAPSEEHVRLSTNKATRAKGKKTVYQEE